MSISVSNKMQNMKPSAIREIFKSLGTPGAISFAAGNPAPESFPIDEFAKLSADVFKTNAIAALQYGITEGYPELRRLVSTRIKDKFNIGNDDDITIITSGGQQAIELTCKVFCNEGDVVLCENPSFIGALNSFRSLGTKPIGIPMEQDGINVEMLEKAAFENKNAKLLYLIPTFHNPTGITMSLEKRKAVYEIARKYDLVIIEDNPYGDLRFDGDDVPTIKSMDVDGRVIYCGSFSKILSAGMRVGFACGKNEYIQKLVVAKQVEDVHTNVFFQMLCAGYINEYDIDEHIMSIRKLYKDKCSKMLAALDKYMPKEAKFTRPQGGLFLWLTLPESVSMADFLKEATENKVFVVPGTAFNCDESAPSDSVRLNYSMPSDEDIEKGVKILGDIIKKLMK